MTRNNKVAVKIRGEVKEMQYLMLEALIKLLFIICVVKYNTLTSSKSWLRPFNASHKGKFHRYPKIILLSLSKVIIFP